jgi:hypothetical protein
MGGFTKLMNFNIKFTQASRRMLDTLSLEPTPGYAIVLDGEVLPVIIMTKETVEERVNRFSYKLIAFKVDPVSDKYYERYFTGRGEHLSTAGETATNWRMEGREEWTFGYVIPFLQHNAGSCVKLVIRCGQIPCQHNLTGQALESAPRNRDGTQRAGALLHMRTVTEKERENIRQLVAIEKTLEIEYCPEGLCDGWLNS